MWIVVIEHLRSSYHVGLKGDDVSLLGHKPTAN